MSFIIIGGGLSGLACGTALARAGHKVCVLEKQNEVGGLARSLRIDGYTFDYGPHYLFGPKVGELIHAEFPALSALTQLSSTRERMFFRDKYFKFPFDPKDMLLRMDRLKIPGVLWDLSLRRMFAHSEDPANAQYRDLEEWVVKSVGHRIYDYIGLAGYIRKLYGVDPAEISHEWGIQKLKFLAAFHNVSLATLVAKALGENKAAEKRVIRYPETGIDYIASQISDAFTASGGKLQLNTEVTRIEHRRGGVRVWLKQDGREQSMEGEFLISTIPISHLVGMTEPLVSAEIKEAVGTLSYRTLFLVHMSIGREKVLNGHASVYFTEESFFFRRITDYTGLSRAMAPPGKSSLSAEVTCIEGDEIYGMDKEAVFQRACQQLIKLGLIKESEIEGHGVLRIPFAYPVYDLHATQTLERVLSNIKNNYRNIISIGRQGLFFYNAMNSSILLGYELGKDLASSGKTGREEIIERTYGARIGKYR